MKTTSFLKTVFLGVLVSTLGCKKDKDNSSDTVATEMQVSQDQNQADNEVEDVASLQDDVMAQFETKLNGRSAVGEPDSTFPYADCATVTITPKGTNPTGRIKVDFGNGCLGADGRYRKGIIYWTFTDRIRKAGAVIVTTFENYGVKKDAASNYVMVDNSSTKVTTNESDADVSLTNTTVRFKREVNMKMIFSDNTAFIFSGTKHVQWELNTLGYRWDNVYTLKSGSGLQGIDRLGRNYTLTVDQDVVRKASCALAHVYKPVSGKITIQHNAKTKVIDFGDGNCDNQITITINGTVTRTRW